MIIPQHPSGWLPWFGLDITFKIFLRLELKKDTLLSQWKLATLLCVLSIMELQGCFKLRIINSYIDNVYSISHLKFFHRAHLYIWKAISNWLPYIYIYSIRRKIVIKVITFLLFLYRLYLFVFRQRGREREGEGEKQ